VSPKVSCSRICARGTANGENTRTERPWAILQTILENSLNIAAAAAADRFPGGRRSGKDKPEKLDRFSRQITLNVTGAGVSTQKNEPFLDRGLHVIGHLSA
jgi:hypothetical protein